MALQVYGLMAIGAAAVLGWRGRLGLLGADADCWLARFGLGGDVAGGLGVGWAIGLAVVLCAHWTWSDRRWTHILEERFREFLAGLTPRQALLLALASGVGEELLFRGVLQDGLTEWRGPWTGWLVSSLLFGVLHTGPGRDYLPWTLFASVMGLLLGGLLLVTGSLLAPIACHVVVNGLHLHEEAHRQAILGPSSPPVVSPPGPR